MNEYLCSDVHQNVGPTCGPMAPLCMNIFLKRTGPKKEGLKNNSVYPASCTSWPHSSALQQQAPSGASIRSVEGPSSLLSLSLSLLPRSSSFAVHPGCLLLRIFILPPFSQGPPLPLTSAVLPPHLPHLIPPLLPLLPCHAFRAPLPPIAYDCSTIRDSAELRGVGLGGWGAGVQSGAEQSGVSSMTHPSPSVISSVLKTLRLLPLLTISAPCPAPHQNLASF